MSQQVLEVLKQRFGSAILETHSLFGDDTAVVEADKWFEIARFLKTDSRTSMTMFVDLCGVDYPDREPRFEVVMHLRSLDRGHRVRIKTRVGDAYGESTEIDSITPVWQGANWFEREAFDMFGIVFEGHPDLRRILLDDDWVGHPLLKSYAVDTPYPPYR